MHYFCAIDFLQEIDQFFCLFINIGFIKTFRRHTKQKLSNMTLQINQQQLQTLHTLFINNLPQKELQPQRLIYHLHLAHDYYIDHFVPPTKPKFKTRDQAQKQRLQKLLLINDSLPADIRLFHSQLKASFQSMENVVRCGAIVSYQDRLCKRYLMIKDRNSGKYGFPKGKLGERQSIQECAMRQTRQETGYNFKCSKTVYTVFMHNSHYNFCRGEVGEIRQLRQLCEGQKFNYQVAEILWVTKDWILNNTFYNAITRTILNQINIFGFD